MSDSFVKDRLKGKKVKRSIAVSGNHLTATGNHMPYGTTQCYLPPGSGDFSLRQGDWSSLWSSVKLQNQQIRSLGIQLCQYHVLHVVTAEDDRT